MAAICRGWRVRDLSFEGWLSSGSWLEGWPNGQGSGTGKYKERLGIELSKPLRY